jgi:hypothetical protein
MNIVPSRMMSFVKLEDESLCYAYLTIYNTSCIVVDLFAAWEYLGESPGVGGRERAEPISIFATRFCLNCWICLV